ncbi:hypothetical protein Vretimale_20043 [Volvox reticuliferus]|uniref:Uncharacterized protein n=1 Tax=Volvox reticuliferus TaxID=1737510 RepID=A0A8J4M073_9CHLO|nr:hypothetical protein Vretimale_20043 [Volvox reticuliferus]
MEKYCQPKENGLLDVVLEKEAAVTYAGKRKSILDLDRRKTGSKEVVLYVCKHPGCNAVLSVKFLADGKAHLQQLELHNHLPVVNKKDRAQKPVAKNLEEDKRRTESQKSIPGHPHICDCVTVQEGGIAVASSTKQRANPPLPSHIWRIESREVAERLGAGRFRPGPADVVLVCDEAAMHAKELAVRDTLKETPDELAFERLLQDACDISGETVFLLLSKEAPAANGSTSRPSSVLTGRSTRLGAAVLQIDSSERIASIRKNYQTLISLDDKIGSRIFRFKADREFLMMGYCLILTDKKAVSPGYAAAVRFVEETGLHPTLLSEILGEIADAVWAEVLERIPELQAFSSRVISEGSRGFTIGKTPFNLMSLAKNQIVEFHLDFKDAHWTVIVWLHGECVIPEGSSAYRYGSSHFLRMPDLENLICLRIGAGNKGLTLEDLKDAASACGKDAICTLRKELIASGKLELRQTGEGQQAWKDAAVQWRDWL